ncbi:hypothetical protein [Mycolicibacterium pallens]|uniref:Uncharacterized protein n=1 Tax=Mycolicibacterium pallens TaxID=370524 RepID=A0ABX8VUU5_9MYCO|nr:hypothetical protein [Mycolicibacterium pallens]QYL19414.1 hypothetical protein K0O64_13545 [Mycolicibacterium pallens]
MSTGHLIGYAGGLAVALGVGAAVILNAPAASADASSATSTSSGHSGTAKTARVTQRTNTVASMRRAPTRKASAPTPSATLPAQRMRGEQLPVRFGRRRRSATP